MKYSLRERMLRLQNQLAAVGMILIAVLTAIWLPMMLAQFASEIWTTPIYSVLSMLAATVIASPLLWIAWEAWKQAWRRPATSEPPLPKRQLASNPKVPSWGKPPPLPNFSAPASNPPKPCTMKYSLRSLMIGLTLICVLLGVWMARVGYLKRWEAYHEREAGRFLQNIQDKHNIPPVSATMVAEGARSDLEIIVSFTESGQTRQLPLERTSDTCDFLFHHRLAGEYHNAASRPWTVVDETRLPKEVLSIPYAP